MHKQQGWPQAWEYCQAKLIQTLERASQGVNWSWSQCIKSHHAQTSSGKELPSHFWNRNIIRSILPGLRRKSTSCFLLLTSFMEKLISFSSRTWHLPTLPKVPKAGSMTMCYCAWLTSKLTWPEAHRESRWETPDPTTQMSWRTLSKQPGLHYTWAVSRADCLDATQISRNKGLKYLTLCVMNLYNNGFHFLKWVTKNIDLFHDIQIYFRCTCMIMN